MARRWRDKRISIEEIKLGGLLAAERNENIVVLKQGSDEYTALVANWKKRLKITRVFCEDNSDTFDYKLVKYNQSFYKEEDIKKYLDEAIDYNVNVFCCYYNDGPDFVVKLLNRNLLNMELYQKIYSVFDFIIVDYKKSGFDCLFNHEGEVWILKF